MNKIEEKVKKNTKIVDFLLNYGFSYGKIQKMLKNKDVRIDNIKTNMDADVFAGQTITVFCEELPTRRFKIVFEDENIIVVNKEQEIEVQGTNSLEEQLNGIAVHRIDRNTEGLVIFAKNKEIEKDLLQAIKSHRITKKYIAEVYGETRFGGEVHCAYLLKDGKESKVKVFQNNVKGSSKIETKFKTIKNSGTTSIVEAELITGKTHQIRAHLAYLQHPIIGDGKYGKNEINKKFKEKYQKLKCFCLIINGLKKFTYLNGKEIEINKNFN